MNEEVAVERACQQVIKFLLDDPQFLERWQEKVVERLRESAGTSHSSIFKPATCQSTHQLQLAVDELASTIEYVITTFEENVDSRNFYLSEQLPRGTANRDASALFEAGFKVEKLEKHLDGNLENLEEEGVANQIAAACRRVSQVVKMFGKRFQRQPSLEVRGTLQFSKKLCHLFYSLSLQISRFVDKFPENRKMLKISTRKVRKSSDEFNLKLLAVMEEAEKALETQEKRQKDRKIPTKICGKLNSNSQPSDYGKIETRAQKKLANSIQEAVRSLEDVVPGKRKNLGQTHLPGSIATSIVPKRRGFLIQDSLARARARVPRVPHVSKPIKVDPEIAPNKPTEEYDVMKSARAVTELVIEEMRQKMRIGNDERLVVGVGE
uniref:Uncharacterized protein n=1 Tax=Caenorhabditis japonica TaxID=281687 RepID=A0A8R1HKJ0_CAEJA